MKKLLFIPILFVTQIASSQIYQTLDGRILQVTPNESLTAVAFGQSQPLTNPQANQAYASIYQLTHADSGIKSIYLYAGSTGTTNSNSVFTFGSGLNSGGSTIVSLVDNKTSTDNLSYWADLMAKDQPKVISNPNLYRTIASIVTIDNTGVPVAFPTNSVFTEQHDVNSVSFFNTSGIQYASLGSSDNGKSSLTLYTSSNSLPGNLGGSISILQKSGEAYGIFVDSMGAIIGSSQNRGRLTLGAGTVFTNGDIESTGFMKSTSGLVVGDVDLSGRVLSQNTLAYFGSNSRESINLEISNQYCGTNTSAGIRMNLYGSSSSLFTYSNNQSTYGINAGSYVMYAQTDNGIVLNAVQNNPAIAPEIRFAINSRLIGAFVDGGFEPAGGLTTDEIFAIPNPREGLEVYNRTIHRKCFYDSKKWQVSACYPLVKI